MMSDNNKDAVRGIIRLAERVDQAGFLLAVEAHRLKARGAWRECAVSWEVFVAKRLGAFPAFVAALLDNGRLVEQALLTQAPPPGADRAQVAFMRASIRDGGHFASGGEKQNVEQTLKAAAALGPKLVEFQETVRSLNNAARLALNKSGIKQRPGESVEQASKRAFVSLFGPAVGSLGRAGNLGAALLEG